VEKMSHEGKVESFQILSTIFILIFSAMYAIVLIALGLTILHLPISVGMLYGCLKAYIYILPFFIPTPFISDSPLFKEPSQLDFAMVFHIVSADSPLHSLFCPLVEWGYF
jgi:hypothetical protein